MTFKSPTCAAIADELERAIKLYPNWPTDPIHAMAVVNEEVGELNKAILQQVYEPHKNPPDAVRKEAHQAAAMLIRFLISFDEYSWEKSYQHQQA